MPPLRPAAFWAVVPPCDELLRVLLLLEPDFFPPRLDAPGEFAIFAARSFDMPFSFSFSYCFSFFTLAFLPGIGILLRSRPGRWCPSRQMPNGQIPWSRLVRLRVVVRAWPTLLLLRIGSG